jgi:hypothetical protein
MLYMKWVRAILLIALLFGVDGCQSSRSGLRASSGRHGRYERIRRVACLYGKECWLNLDKAGDQDPEGIRYRVFLDPGTGRGVLAEGTFHIQMYLIEKLPDGTISRPLASDWHYATSDVHTIAKTGMLGEGYWLFLMWASKDTAGKEIEMVTEFEDLSGYKVRSGTKRFRVPKYTR